MAKRPTDPKYVTRMQLAERWGVSGMFIERKIRTDPTFPQYSRFGDGRLACRRWILAEIEAWERSRVARFSA
jgi:predicted DNA-binding transcriptional regulator AlpA